MSITDDFKKAIDLLNSQKNWLITSHTRPDGDAVGCVKAFCEAAKQFSKSAQPILLSPPAQWYKNIFSPPVPVLGNDMKIEDLQAGKYDLVIIVDTNSYVQLPEFDKWLKTSKIPVLVIDHHVTGDNLGNVEVIDDTAAATGEIVFDLFKFAEWQITPAIAEALFIAVSTDTGWFRFDNTDSRVMRNASALIEFGARPSELYEKLYRNFSEARFRLMIRMLNSLELDFGGRYASVQLTREDFEQTGASYEDTENFIDQCKRIATVQIVALFVEQRDGGIRCSMRGTGTVNVCNIMQKFGGGGHAMAAASPHEGSIEEVKKKIRAEVKEYFSK
jgi:phosphoesterase RecJ-like protein